MKSIVQKLYAYRFLDELMLIFPLYAVMFADSGLSAFQISILFVVWSVAGFLLEVPSGVLADKYSRKYILIIAQIAKIIGFSFWIIMPNFWGFLIGFIFWGIKSALYSGTFESLLYDELKSVDKQNDYTKILGRMESIGMVGVILAGIAASLVSPFGYPMIIGISIFFVIVSLIPLMVIPHAKQAESTHEKEYFTLLKQGLTVAATSPVLLRLILFLAAAIGIDAVIDEFYNPFVREVGLATQYLGYFFALAIFVDILGSLVAYRFQKLSNKFYYVLFTICGGILLLASLLGNMYSLVLLLLFSFAYRIVKLNFEGRVQDLIPTSVRATVSSVKGFALETSSIAMFFLFGIVTGEGEYQSGFIVTACIMTGLGILYLLQWAGRYHISKIKS